MTAMKKKILLLLLLMMAVMTAGCGNQGKIEKVVLTTGFEKDEVFRVEDISCTLPEIMLLLTNTRNQYEAIYGDEIWEKDFNGTTLEENIKETVLAQISQIKIMNLLARQNGITLDEEETGKVAQAAQAYYETLNETEIREMNVTCERIEALYGEYALAEKIYKDIIKDINPEISDDEARTITVQHILFKTYEMDGTGRKIDYSEDRKAKVLQEAKEVLKMAKEEGSDFEQLVLEYSEGEKGTVSFGKGEMESAFEETGFNLETGEISEIIETSYGYHIIKCINTFNREETDANKIKIVEKRREEVFGQEYEVFADTLTKKLNDDLWEEVSFPEGEEITTTDFFEIYHKYMGE